MTTEQYGVANDGIPGTPLNWDVFVPDSEPPWNLIIVSSCSGFKVYSEAPTVLQACIDSLVAAGNFVLAPHTRLVKPPGITGQVGTGWWPQQHDDIALAISTARQDERVIYGSRIGIVGGSGGGTHAGWACCNGTDGDDKADFGVLLSPATDYGDWTPDAVRLPPFKSAVTKYVHSQDQTVCHNASLVMNLGTPNPMFIASADNDSMPLTQAPDLTNALDAIGVGYLSRLISMRGHAFALWPNLITAGEVMPWIVEQQAA